VLTRDPGFDKERVNGTGPWWLFASGRLLVDLDRRLVALVGVNLGERTSGLLLMSLLAFARSQGGGYKQTSGVNRCTALLVQGTTQTAGTLHSAHASGPVHLPSTLPCASTTSRNRHVSVCSRRKLSMGTHAGMLPLSGARFSITTVHTSPLVDLTGLLLFCLMWENQLLLGRSTVPDARVNVLMISLSAISACSSLISREVVDDLTHSLAL
jgi:hypothetical protein